MCLERKGFCPVALQQDEGGKMTPAVVTFGGKRSVACREVFSTHSVSHEDILRSENTLIKRSKLCPHWGTQQKNISKTGMKGGTGRQVDEGAESHGLPWPSFCRCIHEKSMGGRWTWEGGDADWMDARQGGRGRGERGGETIEQRNIDQSLLESTRTR